MIIYIDIMIIQKECGEKSKAIEIVKKMKNEEMDINIIMKITGLTKDEIEKL